MTHVYNKKLLAESDLTLERAIKTGRTAAFTRQRQGVLQKELKSVNFTKKKKFVKKENTNKPQQSGSDLPHSSNNNYSE